MVSFWSRSDSSINYYTEQIKRQLDLQIAVECVGFLNLIYKVEYYNICWVLSQNRRKFDDSTIINISQAHNKVIKYYLLYVCNTLGH